MLNILESILSVFISPWQFFKESAPAPTIEIRLLKSKDDESVDWQELKLRAKSLSWFKVLKSLFYNPNWNEAIYIYDCAERLVVDSSKEDEEELVRRIRARLSDCDCEYFQFRIIFTARFNTELQSDILFSSNIEELNS